MKRFILSITLTLLFINNANCQLTKKNWLIGGVASFSSSKYEGTGTTNEKQVLIQLDGNIGYFIVDKFTVGLKPGYQRTETTGFVHKVVNTYAIGPFARYYFLPQENYINIFAEANYQYGLLKTNENPNTTNSNKITGLAGCSIFFNSSVALELTMGYSHFLYSANSTKVKSIIAGIGFQFHLEKEN